MHISDDTTNSTLPSEENIETSSNFTLLASRCDDDCSLNDYDTSILSFENTGIKLINIQV